MSATFRRPGVLSADVASCSSTRWRTPLALAAALAIAGAAAAMPAPADAARHVHRDISYDLESPPPASQPTANLLDIYRPRGARKRARRPVVVFVHGGGWRRGDKGDHIRHKADLFTSAGFLFVSVNYRLTLGEFDPKRPNPRRTLFPDHPRDVGEALAWVDRNVRRYGGDRRRVIVVGYSAGAQLASLVATDPRHTRRQKRRIRRPIGFVSLDSPVFDIPAAADPEAAERPQFGKLMLWNAFGTPEENGRSGAWRKGSPLGFADRRDPPGLLVVQRDLPLRVAENVAMARALGQRPRRSVVKVDLTHGGVSRMLGRPDDTSGETEAVMRFVQRVNARARR